MADDQKQVELKIIGHEQNHAQDQMQLNIAAREVELAVACYAYGTSVTFMRDILKQGSSAESAEFYDNAVSMIKNAYARLKKFLTVGWSHESGKVDFAHYQVDKLDKTLKTIMSILNDLLQQLKIYTSETDAKINESQQLIKEIESGLETYEASDKTQAKNKLALKFSLKNSVYAKLDARYYLLDVQYNLAKAYIESNDDSLKAKGRIYLQLCLVKIKILEQSIKKLALPHQALANKLFYKIYSLRVKTYLEDKQYEQASQLAFQVLDISYTSYINRLLGDIYKEWGRYSEAHLYYIEALRIKTTGELPNAEYIKIPEDKSLDEVRKYLEEVGLAKHHINEICELKEAIMNVRVLFNLSEDKTDLFETKKESSFSFKDVGNILFNKVSGRKPIDPVILQNNLPKYLNFFAGKQSSDEQKQKVIDNIIQQYSEQSSKNSIDSPASKNLITMLENKEISLEKKCVGIYNYITESSNSNNSSSHDLKNNGKKLFGIIFNELQQSYDNNIKDNQDNQSAQNIDNHYNDNTSREMRN